MIINEKILIALIFLVIISIFLMIGLDFMLFQTKKKYGDKYFSNNIGLKSIFNKLKKVYNQKSKLIESENYYLKFNDISNSNIDYYIFDLWNVKTFISVSTLLFIESLILSKEGILNKGIYYSKKINYFLSLITPVLICAIVFFYFYDIQNISFLLISYFIVITLKIVLIFFRYHNYLFIEKFVNKHITASTYEKEILLKLCKVFIFEDFGFVYILKILEKRV